MRGHHRVGDGVLAETTDVLPSFFAELDRSGVQHALLHDPDDPFGRPGSDIDFVVAPHDLRRVERLALGFPLLVKPRQGTGSRGMRLVARRPVPEPVLTTGTARRFWTEQFDDEARLS